MNLPLEAFVVYARGKAGGVVMPPHFQGVSPMIDYEDGAAAIAWLTAAFGFKETMRITGKAGQIEHAEMRTEFGSIMLATAPSPHYHSPNSLKRHFEPARRWLDNPWVIDGVLVFVTDVDAHHANAKLHGATILSPPEDGPPARRYRVEDVEGHRWMFMSAPNNE